MHTPDDFLLKLFDYAWAVVLALVGLVWKQQEKKIEDITTAMNARVADLKMDHDTKIDEISTELGRHRDVMAKIFDKLEEHGRRSEDRHLEVVRLIHEGLARKADR